MFRFIYKNTFPQDRQNRAGQGGHIPPYFFKFPTVEIIELALQTRNIQKVLRLASTEIEYKIKVQF